MGSIKFPFKNFAVYRMTDAFRALDPSTLTAQVELRKYQSGGELDNQNAGWAPVAKTEDIAYVAHRQWLLNYRSAKKVMPATVVRDEVEKLATELEKQRGYRPGRKQMKELKERVVDTLLPKAFTMTKDTCVWFDFENGWVVVDTYSESRREEILSFFGKTFEVFPAQPLIVNQSAEACMTRWLVNDEPPEGFSIDQDAELRAHNETRAAIKIVHETPAQELVESQVLQGKRCIKLAMTWQDKISFVLSQGLTLRKVAPLNLLSESYSTPEDKDAQFQSMVTLFTGEGANLLASLVAAVGGESEEKGIEASTT